MSYYDLDWSKSQVERAASIHKDLELLHTEKYPMSGIMVACLVTARGFRWSPSSVVESLVRKKPKARTNAKLAETLSAMANILCSQVEVTAERMSILESLIDSKKHRSEGGISDTLEQYVATAYESILDAWTVSADTVIGARTLFHQVLKVPVISTAQYLATGMTRAQLLAAYIDELPEAIDEDEGDGDD